MGPYFLLYMDFRNMHILINKVLGYRSGTISPHMMLSPHLSKKCSVLSEDAPRVTRLG